LDVSFEYLFSPITSEATGGNCLYDIQAATPLVFDLLFIKTKPGYKGHAVSSETASYLLAGVEWVAGGDHQRYLAFEQRFWRLLGEFLKLHNGNIQVL
jgi:hypothetical protein